MRGGGSVLLDSNFVVIPSSLEKISKEFPEKNIILQIASKDNKYNSYASDIKIKNLEIIPFQTGMTMFNFINNNYFEEKSIKDLEEELEEESPNIDYCLNILDNYVDSDDKGKAFDLMLEKLDKVSLVNELYNFYKDNQDKLLDLIQKSKLNSIVKPKKDIKVVAMYSTQLTNIGGIERVVEALTKLYTSMEYRVVLITETPSEEDYIELPDNAVRYDLPKKISYLERILLIKNIIKKEKIDIIIFNGWLIKLLIYEIIIYKAFNIPFIVHTHNVFSYSILDYNPFFSTISKIYSIADGVICLSDVDKAYWKNFNTNVHKVFNPIIFDTKATKPSKLENNNILWLARVCPEKKLEEAIWVMSEVCKAEPNAKLNVVGLISEQSKEFYYNLAVKLGVKNNIEFYGFQEDVTSFLEKSSICLHTAKVEGFPLALLESKAFGLPIVLYELPYLTICEGNRGMFPVKFGDHKSASKEIIKLLTNRELLKQAGQEARDHALEISNYDYQGVWEDIFASLSTPRKDINLSEPERKMWETLLNHIFFKESKEKDVYMKTKDFIDNK